MFSNLAKKGHAQADVKKSTQKILDTKKDSVTRLKHLRIILENVDLSEAKYIFETHYSHIYYLFYDVYAAAESGSKLKPQRVHREDVESVLYILEHILLLLPELLQQRWQLHSISRVMCTLLHPANILRLRREAIRLFIIWFQILGEQASDQILSMFATLVPGFPVPASHQAVPTAGRDQHDPVQVTPAEVAPILPPQGSEKAPSDLTRFFLECLMDVMVTQVPRVEWKDRSRAMRCFQFLFDSFKQFYLPHIFPDFNWHTNLYKPSLVLPELRRQRSSMADSVDGSPRCPDRFFSCRVVVIRWVASFSHSPTTARRSVTSTTSQQQPSPYYSGAGGGGSGDDGSYGTPELRRASCAQDVEQPCSLHSLGSDSSTGTLYTMDSRDRVDARMDEAGLVRDVLFGSRQNVNFVHEVFRQAFLLDCNFVGAIKRVIMVYKDWIQMTVPIPPFIMEPTDNPPPNTPNSETKLTNNHPSEDNLHDYARPLRQKSDTPALVSQTVRAGLQNMLQLFITNSSNVFLLEISPEYRMQYIEDQLELCKRILNMYRYLVMNVHMTQRTWEQLLLALLQITTLTLTGDPAQRAREQALGAILARPLFQTLIVTWVKANLNVTVSADLWDQFLSVLSNLTGWEELIREWAKTLETLTRVLARQVYDLDLNNLPLDRLSEQKTKRRRGKHSQSKPGWTQDAVGAGTAADVSGEVRYRSDRCTTRQQSDDGPRYRDWQSGGPGFSRGDTAARRSAAGELLVGDDSCSRRVSTPTMAETGAARLIRSMSEGSLAPSMLAVDLRLPTEQLPPLVNSCAPRGPVYSRLSRKLSRSVDSLRAAGSLCSGTSGVEYRSRSPSPSSCMETNSVKESPMTLDLLAADGNSIDTIDSASSEYRSVMSGGTLRGWMPDVAAVLWRRMLGALGDVNHIQNPTVHAQVFDYLIELCDTLIKIEMNLGVSLDGCSSGGSASSRPELVPPLPLLVPWCLEALELPDSHRSGRQRALRLLCTLQVRRQPSPPTDTLAFFYRALHAGCCSPDAHTVATLVRHCGPAFFSLHLPSASLLVLDFIRACVTVTASSEIRGVPRVEAVAILGSLVCFANRWPVLEALQPDAADMSVVPCTDLKDSVVAALLKAGKREPSVAARSTALLALAIYLYEELTHATMHDKIKDVINILLSALKCNNRSVGQIAASMLMLLVDHASILLQRLPDVPRKIIEVVSATLESLVCFDSESARAEEGSLSVLLIHCMGEWCMKVPVQVLSETDGQGRSLLCRVIRALSTKTGQRAAVPSEIPSSSSFVSSFVSVFVTDPDEQVLNVIVAGRGSGGRVSSRSSSSDGIQLPDAGPSIPPPSSPSDSSNPHRTRTADRGAALAAGGSTQLAAFSMVCHLLNHLDHFPMLFGAVPLGSLVSEHDDLSHPSPLNELNQDIFTAPNVQFFVLNGSSLMSLVELPTLEVPGGGVTAGLCTARSQVRVILRDVSGKFCWDASVLHATDEQLLASSVSPSVRGADGSCWHAAAVASSPLPQQMQHGRSEESLLVDPAPLLPPPRHRPPQQLPDWQNTEQDMDNLDDLLRYIKHTSPECASSVDSVAVLPSIIGADRLSESINALLSQRNAENDATAQSAHSWWPSLSSESCERCRASSPAVGGGGVDASQQQQPFQHARLLISQLGLTSWQQRPHIHLLKRSDQLLRQLRNLDNQKCRETHKVAVIYVSAGQEDKRSILANVSGSDRFEEFVAGMAWEVELESHTGFMGGLQKSGVTGETAPYHATSFTEVMFHVSTRMPSLTEEAMLQKTRHLGNDEVHIVWSEHWRDYRRGIIPTEFCDVLIVVYPLDSDMYRIQISRKPEVPFFGPLFDGAIVGRRVLPGLVRATAIAASRAKRSMLPFYLTYYEERQKALETLISSHRDADTFESFVSNVYRPAPTDTGSGHRTVPGRQHSDGGRSTGGALTQQQLYDFVGSTRTLAAAAASASAAVATTASTAATADLNRTKSGGVTLNPSAAVAVALLEVDVLGSSCYAASGPSPKTLKRLSFKTGVRKASSSLQETIQGGVGRDTATSQQHQL